MIPVQRLDLRGIALPVLLGRRRVAEIVVKVIVGSRTVGEHAHLDPCRVDPLRHEPVVADPAAQVVHIEAEDGRRVGTVDLQDTALHFARHSLHFGLRGVGRSVCGGRNLGTRRELRRVERLGARIEHVAGLVVREQVNACIQGRHRPERHVEIIVGGVVAGRQGPLRQAKRHDRIPACKGELGAACGTRILVEASSTSEYPAGPSVAESLNHVSPAAFVTRHGAGASTEILPARASPSSDRKCSPPLITIRFCDTSSSLHAAVPESSARQRKSRNNLFIKRIVFRYCIYKRRESRFTALPQKITVKFKPHGLSRAALSLKTRS